MIKRLYRMWLRKKLDKEEYEDVVMDVIDKLNEVIDYIQTHEEEKKRL